METTGHETARTFAQQSTVSSGGQSRSDGGRGEQGSWSGVLSSLRVAWCVISSYARYTFDVIPNSSVVRTDGRTLAEEDLQPTASYRVECCILLRR